MAPELLFDLRLCFLWNECGFILSMVAIVTTGRRSGLVQCISAALLNIALHAGGEAAADSQKGT